jgi:hypothetical protein
MFIMCVRRTTPAITPEDKIVCAILTGFADGDCGKRWDLIQQYFRALDDFAAQREERRRERGEAA